MPAADEPVMETDVFLPSWRGYDDFRVVKGHENYKIMFKKNDLKRMRDRLVLKAPLSDSLDGYLKTSAGRELKFTASVRKLPDATVLIDGVSGRSAKKTEELNQIGDIKDMVLKAYEQRAEEYMKTSAPRAADDLDVQWSDNESLSGAADDNAPALAPQMPTAGHDKIMEAPPVRLNAYMRYSIFVQGDAENEWWLLRSNTEKEYVYNGCEALLRWCAIGKSEETPLVREYEGLRNYVKLALPSIKPFAVPYRYNNKIYRIVAEQQMNGNVRLFRLGASMKFRALLRVQNLPGHTGATKYMQEVANEWSL